MIKTTFKNVGQGDSIIIEWEKKGLPYLGIIDCKRHSSANPVIDYLRSLKEFRLHFIVLSHPHYDHYSGLYELLSYCEDNRIEIYRFVHTMNVLPGYLNHVSDSEAERTALAQIIDKFETLVRAGLIWGGGSLSLDWRLDLSDRYTIRCLSPTAFETRRFCEQVDYYQKEKNVYQSRQAANYLSSVLKLDVREDFVLLTADAEKPTFERLLQHFKNEPPNRMLLGQIPHHGSIKNHHIDFWSSLDREAGCPLAVSAGVNTHGHPSPRVIDELLRADYTVKCTIEEKYYRSERLAALDDISEEVFGSSDLEYRFS